MWKIIKRILLVLLVLFIGAVGVIAYIGYQMTEYYSDEDVYGDVVLLLEGNVKVGDIVPMAFVVPEAFSDLHKEMWDCYLKDGSELSQRSDYIIEHVELEEKYTDDEIMAMFANGPIDIRNRGDSYYKYTSRIALFIPEEPGTFHINIFGYYRTTSPQGYGGTEVIVYE